MVSSVCYLFMLLPTAGAFVRPSLSSATALNIQSFSFTVADGLSAATRLNGDTAGIDGMTGMLEQLRSFFIVVTAIVFGLTALAYLTAAVIVPQAAAELEKDTKRLRPGLWEEYEAKLEEGETMVNRPDLLQELGNIMQPIIVKDYEVEADKKFGPDDSQGKEERSQLTTNDEKMEDRVVDVEVIE